MAEAALAVLDREGLAAVSMRSVAAELGMGTMSLYRYVDGREQLEGLVVDIVLDVDLTLPATASWRNRVELLAQRARDAIADHPAVVPVLLTYRHSTRGSLRWGEALLQTLTLGGHDGERRVIAFRTLLSYVIGAVQVEHLGPLSGPGTAALAALPTDEYPYLAATARVARHISAEEEFRRGLAVVLDGLDTQ